MHNLQTEEKLENIMYYHHHSLLHRLQIKQETIERKERQQRTACCINLCEAAFVIHDLRKKQNAPFLINFTCKLSVSIELTVM